MHKFIRSMLVALVVAGVAAPSVAPAADAPVSKPSKRIAAAKSVSAVEANDNIPGVAAPASPIVGTLDEFTDTDDVYKFYLTAGQSISIDMVGPADPADYDLYLFDPTATDAWSDIPVAESGNVACTEAIDYTAVTTGYHYLDIMAWAGSGTYTVTYTTTTLPNAANVTSAKFSNPIAYKLKSLLSTQFQCTVDAAGTTGKLEILNGTGGVVKTVYNGALVNGTNKLPAWNGLDKYGRRLPSSSYKWRLVVSKPGCAPVTTYGNITISKIYFLLAGNSSATTQNFSRYMVPGNANLYFAMNTTELTGDVFSLAVKEPSGISTGAFAWSLAAPGTVNRTGYLKSTTAVKQFGMHNFAIRSNHATAYSVIVIQ